MVISPQVVLNTILLGFMSLFHALALITNTLTGPFIFYEPFETSTPVLWISLFCKFWFQESVSNNVLVSINAFHLIFWGCFCTLSQLLPAHVPMG